jgi:uncharacterized protein (TIGR02147 family)
MQENPQPNDYRDWLRAELKRRQRVNARYSLRSFALALEISPAFLSKVLSGKKNLSIGSAFEIGQKLQFSESEQKTFCQWVAKQALGESAEALMAGSQDSVRQSKVSQLELEAFQVISDWYHFALRELVQTKGFKSEPEWIAQRLGISTEEAATAFERLQRLGLIEKKRGLWRKSEALLVTPSGVPSRALRHHHMQMIQKAKESLETQTVLERDITGITIPTHPENIEIVREEIKKFRRRMSELLDSKNPSEVYQLNVQLFRLSQKPSDQEKK